MATTTARRRPTKSINYYFDTPSEVEFPDMDKDLYTPEDAYELTMKDIKAIYDRNDAV